MSEPMTDEQQALTEAILATRECRRLTPEEFAQVVRLATQSGLSNLLRVEADRARASEATLTAQLRTQEEALRVAREKLEAIEATGYGCTCDNAGPCGCGKTCERIAESALAAIEEATRAP